MTTAIIGIGNIGGTVARELAAGGEPVVISAVNPDDLAEVAPGIGSPATAAPSNRRAGQRADPIVLAPLLCPPKNVADAGAGRLHRSGGWKGREIDRQEAAARATSSKRESL